MKEKIKDISKKVKNLKKINVKEKLIFLKDWFLKASLKKKVLISVGVVAFMVGIISGIKYLVNKKQSEPQYQTSLAEKGTLVVSISGSGTITSGNTTNITTGATGTVKSVYVKNGDTITKGQKIAEITLDDYGQERQSAAYVSYLNALEAVKTAEKDKADADLQMWEDRDSIYDAIDAIDYKNNNTTNPTTHEDYTDSEKAIIDKTLEKAKKSLEESELKYKNADADIANARVKVTAAWADYKEVSSTVYAPASGTVENLVLAEGITISSSSDSSISITEQGTSSSTSSTTISVSSQNVGSVRNVSGNLQASIDLSEVDIVSIKSDQKVTLTMDAFPDSTFTGKVLAVDTTGSVSSGVTNYSVTVLLDPTTINVYPNMAVSAEIIVSVKTDVILVSSSAIEDMGDKSYVKVMKDGEVTSVEVEIGESNDSQTEIVSGINEGDEVVIETIISTSSSKTTDSETTSPFSSIGGSSTGGGGGMPMDGGMPR